MAPEQNRHDDAIDQVLAAMRHAAPPEGMDARILQRLQQQQAASANQPPASPALTSAWWRGAFTGAAAALVTVSAVLLVQHALRKPSTPPQIAQSSLGPTSTPAATSPHAIAVTASRSAPCTRPTDMRLANIAPPPQIETNPGTANLLAETRADSVAPSRPAPAMPLTAQERELVRLTHTADPKQLAEEEAKVDEERAAEFARLSAHPSSQSSSQAHADASLDPALKVVLQPNPENPSDASLEADPEANQPSPGTDPQPNPPSNEQSSSLTKEEQ